MTFTGIREFAEAFPTEKACEDYLFSLRFPEGFVCPTCGSTTGYRKDREIQCPNRHWTSLTAGTALHKTKQPILAWFWAAYFVGAHTPGISAVQFQKHLKIKRYETAFQMLHKVRSALVVPDRQVLRGTVEVDETFLTNRAGARVIVMGAVEVLRRKGATKLAQRRPTLAGRLRLQVVQGEDAATFVRFCRKHIASGSTICTDGDPSYGGLTRAGYVHQPAVQGRGRFAVYGLDHLHRSFSNFKNWLAGTHHQAVSRQHMQAYCNEFVFRHNRREMPWISVLRVLGLVRVKRGVPEYRTLYGVRAGRVKPKMGRPAKVPWVHPNPHHVLRDARGRFRKRRYKGEKP